MFEEHGELLTLFEKFKSLKSKEDQETSLELAEHATTVMTTLDEGIKGLDDLDTFFEYLHQVGASHRRIPGFKAEYFWVCALFLLYFCKTQKIVTAFKIKIENLSCYYQIAAKRCGHIEGSFIK